MLSIERGLELLRRAERLHQEGTLDDAFVLALVGELARRDSFYAQP